MICTSHFSWINPQYIYLSGPHRVRPKNHKNDIIQPTTACLIILIHWKRRKMHEDSYTQFWIQIIVLKSTPNVLLVHPEIYNSIIHIETVLIQLQKYRTLETIWCLLISFLCSIQSSIGLWHQTLPFWEKYIKSC